MNKIFTILIAVVSIVIITVIIPVLATQIDTLTDYTEEELQADVTLASNNHVAIVEFDGLQDHLDYDLLNDNQADFNIEIPANVEAELTYDTSNASIIVTSYGVATDEYSWADLTTATIVTTITSAQTINVYDLLSYLATEESTTVEALLDTDSLNITIIIPRSVTESDLLGLYSDDTTYMEIFELAIYNDSTTGTLINLLPTIIIAGVVIATVALVYIKKRG